MGMFEQFGQAAANQAVDKVNTKVTFSFKTLPKSIEDFEALPQSAMTTPFMTAAMTILALCCYADDRESGIEMLNLLRGPRTLQEYDIDLLDERLSQQKYLPYSYLKGAVPKNGYTPSVPYSITVYETQTSYVNEGYAQIYVHSESSDNPHQITLRWRNDQWLLWEQYVLIGIH